MSTVTAVQKNGTIAIACDSLIKWGNEMNAAKYVINHNKIIKIKDSYLAITGPAAGLLALKHYFAHTKNKFSFDNVDDIFFTFTELQLALKEDYYFEYKSEETGFESNSLYVLIVNSHGIFAVGAFRDVQQFDQFYSYGSGNEYALGAMFHCYNDPTLSAEQIALAGINAAAEFDDSTALPHVMYSVKAKV